MEAQNNNTRAEAQESATMARRENEGERVPAQPTARPTGAAVATGSTPRNENRPYQRALVRMQLKHAVVKAVLDFRPWEVDKRCLNGDPEDGRLSRWQKVTDRVNEEDLMKKLKWEATRRRYKDMKEIFREEYSVAEGDTVEEALRSGAVVPTSAFDADLAKAIVLEEKAQQRRKSTKGTELSMEQHLEKLRQEGKRKAIEQSDKQTADAANSKKSRTSDGANEQSPTGQNSRLGEQREGRNHGEGEAARIVGDNERTPFEQGDTARRLERGATTTTPTRHRQDMNGDATSSSAPGNDTSRLDSAVERTADQPRSEQLERRDLLSSALRRALQTTEEESPRTSLEAVRSISSSVEALAPNPEPSSLVESTLASIMEKLDKIDRREEQKLKRIDKGIEIAQQMLELSRVLLFTDHNNQR